MKSLMTFIGILALNFNHSAQASSFSCPVDPAFSNYTCSGTVKVKTIAELNAYKSNLGVIAKKPMIAKNLQIDFNPIFSSDLILATPCSIKIPSSTVINSTANICLNGSRGVMIGNGFQFDGKNLKLESKEEVVINEDAFIKASNIKLLSIGDGASSKTFIKKGAHIEAANLWIESFDKGFIGKNSNVILTGALGIYSLGDDEASVRQGTKVEAQKIEISSTEETRIANLTTLIASQIILNGKVCNINKGAVITSVDRLGNCFLASLTKAKFSIDKNQGNNPLVVSFNASAITNAKGFTWTFGDGETVNTLTPTTSHLYNRVGSFTATLSYATKDNYKGLKSAGSVQIDVKAPPINTPTIPPRGYFNYAQDGTFVYLKAFIKRTQFDIANAYYVIDDNQNNKILITNFYQASMSTVEMHTLGFHKVTMYVEDVQGQKYNTTMNIDLKTSEEELVPTIRFYGEQSSVRTAFINMSSSFIPYPDEPLKDFTVEFGDGQTAIIEGATSIVHTYALAGIYNVKVSAQYNGNPQSLTIPVTVTNEDKPAINPVAGFEYHIFDFAGNVTFNDDRSGTPNGKIISYEWNFGDGSLGYGLRSSHFFPPGEYLVSLTVTDTAGLRSTQTQKVNIVDVGDDLVTSLQCYQKGEKTLNCDIFALDKANQITRVKVEWGDGTSKLYTEAEISEWGLYFDEHIYQNYGTYTAKLTVDTSRGETRFSFSTQTFVVSPSVVPVANIQCTTNNLLVMCNALGSYDPQGKPLTYSFNYGDTFVETNMNGLSTHAYSSSGFYNIILKVKNSDGLEALAYIGVLTLIPPENQLPRPSLFCTSATPYILKCNAQFSIDFDGSIVSYKYIWDDNTQEIHGTSDEIFHIFTSGGNHQVTLEVTDDAGGVSSVTNTFSVNINTPPIISYLNCTNTGPQRVTCYTNAYDPDANDLIKEYEWDFGNGEIISSMVPYMDYTYSSSSTYQIKLNVKDMMNATATALHEITTIENQAPIANIICNLNAGSTYQCDSNASDIDGQITSTHWMIDGHSLEGNSILYDFTNGGNYQISLELIDDLGKVTNVFIS